MQGLSSIFAEKADCQFTVLAREATAYESTYPVEIVTCQFNDGDKLRLLCKYSAGIDHNSYGHRGGVRYEVEVYRNVLKPIGCSTPRFYGYYTDPNNENTWLVIEYIDNCQRLSWGPIPQILVDAARWLANFHVACEVLLSSNPPLGLNTYDRAYYIGWTHRASQFAGPLHGHFPWFKTLCNHFEKFSDALLEAPQTVIHGEFYPQNVLIRNGIISPIDWESAAVAAGQIDLSTLTEGYPEDIVTECELAYQQARWPDGIPAGSGCMLDAARIYMHLRWLGDRPSWTMQSLQRFEKLRLIGEKCGLI